jgi:hypothetical protein
MLKRKLLKQLEGIFDEWLLGFNPATDFQVGLFSSEKINLKNAVLNHNRVNKALCDEKVPFRLKAGLIGRLTVKTSLLNLFSESVVLEIQDVHMVLGPNRDEMSADADFSDDAKGCFYDVDDQVTNIVMMHELVEELRKPEMKEKSRIK